MRKYSEKGLIKRKSDRAGYSEFFMRHVEIIKENNLHCQECGKKLTGDVSEVAHILEKQKFKSVALSDNNIIYLCGWKTGNCHSNFDGSNGSLWAMNAFITARKKLNVLLELVTEKMDWKILAKWKID